MDNELILRDDSLIDRLELEALMANNPVECPITRRFAKGIYSREIFMPKNQFVSGKIHKEEHLFALMQGVLAISTDGVDWEIYVAPYTGVSKAGTRRVAYIFQDTIFASFHANPDNETNPEILDDRYVTWKNKLIEKEFIEFMKTKNINFKQ